jgi:plastocyanin
MKPLIAVLATAAVFTSSAAFADGSITGSVKFTGKVPERKKLKREADALCAKTEMKDEAVLVNEKNSTLQNVIVRIAKGVSKVYPAPAAPAVMDQVNCMYRPRVIGVVAGQKLQIKNSDNTLHNVHTFLGKETVFNRAMTNDKAPPIEQPIEVKGDVGIMRFQCDVHSWMKAYVSVTKHPFFSVTGEPGTFDIKGLPAGKYTLEAVHEKYGTKTQEIEVTDGAPTTGDFTFDAADKKAKES